MKKFAKLVITRALNKKVTKLLESKDIKVITVTGSIGKSSAKVAIGQLLSVKYRVNYSEDSYNTDIGLPLGIFGLKVPARLWDVKAWNEILRQVDKLSDNYPYEVVVVEVADDERAMMEPIVRKLRPQLGVLTGVAPVHMARMRDMTKITRDSWVLANLADKVIYNADFDELRLEANKSSTALGYGIGHGAVQFEHIKRSQDGYLKAELCAGGQKKVIVTRHIAEVGLYNLLAAASVGLELGMNFAEIARELSNIGPLIGRVNLLAGVKGARLIDDSYNSSPRAAIAALGILSQFKGRKIAILGSMNELGDYSVEAHTQVGEKAGQVADLLVVVGQEAERYLLPAATHAGLDKGKVKYFRTPYVAGHYVKKIIEPGDVVLIKGSQDKVYTEEATRILLDEKLDPRACLVRQSVSWKRKKKRAFAL